MEDGKGLLSYITKTNLGTLQEFEVGNNTVCMARDMDEVENITWDTLIQRFHYVARKATAVWVNQLFMKEIKS